VRAQALCLFGAVLDHFCSPFPVLCSGSEPIRPVLFFPLESAGKVPLLDRSVRVCGEEVQDSRAETVSPTQDL
jgi:hypothetical protein